MATHSFSLLSIPSSISSSCKKRHDNSLTHNCCEILSTSFTGRKLSIRHQNFEVFTLKPRRSIVETVSPIGIPERAPSAPSDKQPKWSARVIKAIAMAEMEARKLKYPNTGTESLLMGILVEGTNLAAKCLRANGITIFKVQEETLKLLGKNDLHFSSPPHPPLTKPAQRALDWAIEEKLKSGESGEVTTVHLLLGIWSQRDFAAHRVLAALGFDDEKAKELAKSMDKDFEFSHKQVPLKVQ